MIVVPGGDEREAGRHFKFIAACIGTGDPHYLEQAAQHLDLLAEYDPTMCETVLAMVELTTGVSWQAIRDSG